MSNRLAFAALGVACIAAAAGGGYLATRQNAIPAPASAQTAQAVPAAVPAATPTAASAPLAPVHETEAVIGDRTSKPAAPQTSSIDAPAATADASKSSRRRAEAPSRTPQSRDNQATATIARRQESPALGGAWPSGGQSPALQPPPAPMPEPNVRPDDRVAQEPQRPAEPPLPTFEDLVIPRDAVIGLQTDNRVSSDTARVEDRVDAHVTRDVRVGDRVAIPAGSRVIGSVTQVERGGKFKEQARLGIRFHTLVLADGTQVPVSTETIVRLGDAPGNGTAAKIGGGAVGGAILGAILGGAKGAAIGAAAGGGAGTAAAAAGDRSTVVLQPGTPLTPRVLSPVTVTVER
jgi:type IV secretory pathway VirB10-like protein